MGNQGSQINIEQIIKNGNHDLPKTQITKEFIDQLKERKSVQQSSHQSSNISPRFNYDSYTNGQNNNHHSFKLYQNNHNNSTNSSGKKQQQQQQSSQQQQQVFNIYHQSSSSQNNSPPDQLNSENLYSGQRKQKDDQTKRTATFGIDTTQNIINSERKYIQDSYNGIQDHKIIPPENSTNEKQQQKSNKKITREQSSPGINDELQYSYKNSSSPKKQQKEKENTPPKINSNSNKKNNNNNNSSSSGKRKHDFTNNNNGNKQIQQLNLKLDSVLENNNNNNIIQNQKKSQQQKVDQDMKNAFQSINIQKNSTNNNTNNNNNELERPNKMPESFQSSNNWQICDEGNQKLEQQLRNHTPKRNNMNKKLSNISNRNEDSIYNYGKQSLLDNSYIVQNASPDQKEQKISVIFQQDNIENNNKNLNQNQDDEIVHMYQQSTQSGTNPKNNRYSNSKLNNSINSNSKKSLQQNYSQKLIKKIINLSQEKKSQQIITNIQQYTPSRYNQKQFNFKDTPTNTIKLSQQQQQNNNINQKIINKKQGDEIVNRIIQKGQKSQEKKQISLQKYKQKEIKECTFQPNSGKNTIRRSQTPNSYQRNFDQFLIDQNLHQIEKEKRILDLRRRQEEREYEKLNNTQIQPSQSPYPSYRNQRHDISTNNVNESSVFDRLYTPKVKKSVPEIHSLQKNKDKILKLVNGLQQNQNQNNQNTIKKNKDQQVSNRLYQDAIKRQEKERSISQMSKMQYISQYVTNNNNKENNNHDNSLNASQISSNTNNVLCDKQSQIHLANKLFKEFQQASLKIVNDNQGAIPDKLTYLQIVEIMQGLKFLSLTQRVDSQNFIQERALLHDMWIGLEGPVQEGVHVRNLLLFILGIMGMYFELPRTDEYNYCGTKIPDQNQNQNHADVSMPMKIDSVDSQQHQQFLEQQEQYYQQYKEQEQQQQQQSSNQFQQQQQDDLVPNFLKQGVKIGEFIDGNVKYTEPDIKYIQKHFYQFYLNKLHGEKLEKNFPQTSQSQLNISQIHNNNNPQNNNSTFDHDKLSRKNSYLAQSYREKLKEKISNNLFIDSSNMDSYQLQVANKEILSQQNKNMKQIQQDIVLDNCSFTPKINRNLTSNSKNNQIYYLKDSADKSDLLQKSRNDLLYDLGKARSSVNKKDRSSDEVNYDKVMPDCSFQPQLISKQFYSKQTKKPSRSITPKGADKTVQRLKKGWQQHVQKQNMLKRGDGPKKERKIINSSNRNVTPNRIYSKQQNNNNNYVNNSITRSRINNSNNNVNKSYFEPNSNNNRNNNYNNFNNNNNNDHNSNINDYIHISNQQQQQQNYMPYGNNNNNDNNIVNDNNPYNYQDTFGQNDDDQPNQYNNNNNGNYQNNQNQNNINNNINKQYQDAYEGPLPLLHIDVNISATQVERITVYDGDNAFNLADNFIAQYGLSSNIRDKLINLIQQQIDSVYDDDENNNNVNNNNNANANGFQSLQQQQ